MGLLNSQELAASDVSEIRAELDRLVESVCLRESEALKGLLRYVVEETLAGRHDGLKEYALGRVVFHRSGQYDPRNDAIVRVQASQLRKRLTAFYLQEGQTSRVRIELPRGGYVPQFVRNSLAETVPPRPIPAPIVEAAGRAWPSRMTIAATVLLALMAAFLLKGFWPTNRIRAGRSIWGEFVNSKRPVVVSLGVPLFFSGGGMFVRDLSVNSGGTPSEVMRKIEGLVPARFRVASDVYTGLGEALGGALVSRWLDRKDLRVTVVNSHALGESDLAGANAVVISSMRFRTMLDQLNLPTAFQYEIESSGVKNLRPLAGEKAIYVSTAETGVVATPSLLTVYPGVSPGTRILYLSGMNSMATQGAAVYSVDEEHSRDLDRRLMADPENGPRGKKGPYFQVLLLVEGMNSQVRHVRYVTHRYLRLP